MVAMTDRVDFDVEEGIAVITVKKLAAHKEYLFMLKLTQFNVSSCTGSVSRQSSDGAIWPIVDECRWHTVLDLGGANRKIETKTDSHRQTN